MSKKPAFDLAALTSGQAIAFPEAQQRTPHVVQAQPIASAVAPREAFKTASLEQLGFRVPAAFRRRFKQRAVTADLKLNELLFEALDAWEEKHGIKVG